ncbi:MAG: hypothetical protein K2X43_15840 [Hyphomonadaceae bacterium]|jgi:hypothetical protein|nr:hypothetical protein [Hyphomonadaceae bacterium]
MLTYVTLAAMAAAGYLGTPLWVVLLGMAGIASEGWWMKLQRLRQHPDERWSNKVTAYFVTGLVANIGLSAVAYALGRLARTIGT